MITELRLTNFKSWKSIEKMRLAPITGLFGTNSSGKSSILQLLLMLKQTIESTDRAQVLEFGDENSLTNLGSFRDTVYRHDPSQALTFGLDWDLHPWLQIANPEDRTPLFAAQQLSFDCNVSEQASQRLAVASLEYRAAQYTFRLARKDANSGKYELDSQGGDFRFKRFIGHPFDVTAPVKFHGFPDTVYASYQNAGFLAQLQLALENLLKQQVYYLGPLREFPQRQYTWKGSEPADMGRRGERVVDALLASRARGKHISPGYRAWKLTLEQRVAIWLKELGLIHSFSVEPVAKDTSIYRVWVQKTSTSAKVLITDVGFGVSQILPVLVLCYYAPEGSIILLEQPEIHLHPSVQSGLADVFIDAAQNRHVQIIVESHSEHLLRRLQRRVADQTIKAEDTALYFCAAEGDGSKLTPLDVDLFGNITNWPKNFFGDEFGEMAEITKAAMQRKQGQQG